ncbi:MAG: electron transfer flavoprotein subunit alpha/FixB family protein [Candidatus Latescibacterota bacterium]|nr:MAG: electron transfer flavoprotein subunit alpha/FixB family protein [Candidatus Latescibacterota bacterium]
MTIDVLVLAEIRVGSFKKINTELISAAKTIAEKTGGNILVATVGDGIDQAIEEAKSYPVHKIFAVKDPVLARYSTQGYASALEAVIKEADPAVVLFGATAMGKDLSARVGARVDAALMTDCTEVDFEDGALKVKRPVYSGKVYANVVSTNEGVKMASVRPNIYPSSDKSGESAEVVEVSVSISEDQIGAVVKEIESTSAGKKDVTEAEIIVAGGRSLKSEENFKILEQLADTMGASVGASRAAVDAGYAPHSQQVGQTGKVVNPKLYIACGISGAIQHLVGMRTSKVIVAINKDANAPIFQHADYGIEGDLFEVVPLLTEEFKKMLGA